jgi:hypothetical protein
MKYLLGLGVYLHLMLGAACLFDLKPAAVLILVCLGMGIVLLVVPGGRDEEKPSLLSRVLRRVK